MEIIKTKLGGAFVAKTNKFQDDRGGFSRLFCKEELGLKNENIMQVNRSVTKKMGTVRGMHYQYPPKAETKIISCVKGKVCDVIIDIRKDSPTFLQYHVEILSEDDTKILVVPKGFAHGFQTLEDDSELIYFHTEFYSPDSEGGIRYDDSLIGIDWPLEVGLVSDRDKSYEFLDENFRGIEL